MSSFIYPDSRTRKLYGKARREKLKSMAKNGRTDYNIITPKKESKAPSKFIIIKRAVAFLIKKLIKKLIEKQTFCSYQKGGILTIKFN